ncbi:hypothetical protein PFISCL1PPCAC_7401, partial [Pristionchus fissidentatus]
NDSYYYPDCLDEVEDEGTLTVSSLLLDRQEYVPYSINKTCTPTNRYLWECTQLDYPMDELLYQHGNTSDFIFDLSYRNLSEFRLVTHFAVPVGEYANMSYFFTGGLSLGHENPLAPSVDGVEMRKSGWRLLRDVMESQAAVVGIDLSNLPAPSTQMPQFSSNITMDSFMDKVIAAMDTKDSVKLWYNNKRWASLPIYTNVLS